ncbi:elongation of very long chain fatty acids protein AAEL008004-like [Harmonia axyridis]|uniref:elongation of very long chain fatty acids protein AAEL008004-like n=1 Tax=Harmonia axyridis TaxID=115357 RepID=UPI001E278C4C|nr:elongation of very long chain fatty acids protein AAEL008004-like [Harmonia axyridis]
MVEVVRNLHYYYKYLVHDLADKRTDEYLFASSPWKPIGIFVLYVLIVKKILPDFMRHRKAFNLDKIILFYNFTQIVFNAYLLYRAIPFLTSHTPVCAPVDYSNNPSARLQLDLCYLYYILKVYDLLDTMFFILRKRERQVTFLHLYHHAMMVTFPWIGLRYVAGGNTMYIGVCNTVVHIVMYFYYAITLWNSGTNKTVWWKKYLTQLQLVQFSLLSIMGFILLVHPTCTYPKLIVTLGMIQNIYLSYLFGTFYYKTYVVQSKKIEIQEKKLV